MGRIARANMRREAALTTVLCFMMLIRVSQGIFWNLDLSGPKCLSEKIPKNVVVWANYLVTYGDFMRIPTISAKVTSPNGNELHRNENATTGEFAFTTTEEGVHQACFSVDDSQGNDNVGMVITWKIGIHAKDWDSVARKENIEGVELALVKLEGAVEAIHDRLLYLRTKEAEMRIVSETTNARVARFSTMSLGVCVVVSVVQLWHLKRFFHEMNLI